ACARPASPNNYRRPPLRGYSRLMGEDETGTAKAVSERRQEARPTSSTRMTGCPNREVRVAIHNDRSTSGAAVPRKWRSTLI
ncbi:MAG: hypothetical protein WB774_01235, partial [Xanthobacteraceae bacterium]